MPKKAGLGAPAQAMRQATLSLGTFVALNTPSATHSERTGSAQTRSETSTPTTPFCVLPQHLRKCLRLRNKFYLELGIGI